MKKSVRSGEETEDVEGERSPHRGLGKKLGVMCKKDCLTEALKTFRNRVKTGVTLKNLRVVNSPPKKTGFETAYDLRKQKIKRFEKDKTDHEKL